MRTHGPAHTCYPLVGAVAARCFSSRRSGWVPVWTREGGVCAVRDWRWAAVRQGWRKAGKTDKQRRKVTRPAYVGEGKQTRATHTRAGRPSPVRASRGHLRVLPGRQGQPLRRLEREALTAASAANPAHRPTFSAPVCPAAPRCLSVAARAGLGHLAPSQ